MPPSLDIAPKRALTPMRRRALAIGRRRSSRFSPFSASTPFCKAPGNCSSSPSFVTSPIMSAPFLGEEKKSGLRNDGEKTECET